MKTLTKGVKKQPHQPTVHLRREDFSEYGLSLGLWEALTDDLGLPGNTAEVEITIVRARKVA